MYTFIYCNYNYFIELVMGITKYYNLDIKKLELLGAGTQGKVYKIDDERCIKIFKSEKHCKEERRTLIIAQGDSHFPELYHFGEKYIVREYVKGLELDEYLLRHEQLTPELIFKLVELYDAMIKVGYTRIDAAIFHVFVTPDNELKLIDTAKAMKKETQIPHLLISGIERLGYKEELFDFLKHNRPELYDKWKEYNKINYKK